jgi:hypothetical protein
MKRREFITLLGGGVATWPLKASAQQPLPVIGYFSGRSPVTDGPMLSAFRQGFSETGFVEGGTSRSNSDGRKVGTSACRSWSTISFVARLRLLSAVAARPRVGRQKSQGIGEGTTT